MAFHNIPGSTRQLKRRLKVETNGAQRFKQAYVKKEISAKNLRERTGYGRNHKHKTIEDHWQYIFFTDEAHIDPSSCVQGLILREKGTRTDPENIQQRPERIGVKLHMAAWVNWHAKAEKLVFYNDENDSIVKPKRPPKPRTRKYESPEEYQQRILEWEASIGHEAELKPKGNSMTQKYYTERLLPQYIEAIHKARSTDQGWPNPWVLQEDNDSSRTQESRPSYAIKSRKLD
jgi:hypothetical protein